MSYDLSRNLFSINGNDFTCGEFLAALDHYGLLDDWKGRVAQGKYFIQKASEENIELDLEVLGEMTNDFRYAEKLLSSDEFNEWLQSVNLELKDFEEYLKREYWREHFSEDEAEDLESEVLDSEILSEMYFSRAFSALLDSWLKRLLAWYEAKSDKPGSFENLEVQYKEYRKGLEKYFDAELWQKAQDGSSEVLDLEELQELFFDEVWMTLKVKYVS